jgi:hypothetical protein
LNFIVIKESNGGGLLVYYQPWLVAGKRNCVCPATSTHWHKFKDSNVQWAYHMRKTNPKISINVSNILDISYEKTNTKIYINVSNNFRNAAPSPTDDPLV